MNANGEHAINEAAYRRLKDQIKQTYPHGQFVGIAGGRIVADAPSFDELEAVLVGQGRDPVATLIVQAGVEYPETGIIFVAAEASRLD